MVEIFFTPASVSFLTQFILALTITVFLARRWRHIRTASLGLLVGFFALVTLFIALLWVDVSTTPFFRLLMVYAQNTVLALALIFLLAFAYRFPAAYARHRWEARALMTLSLAYVGYEAVLMVWRYHLLAQGEVTYRPDIASVFMAVVMAFPPWAFVRQTLAADPRPAAWWRKLLQPQGREAGGARNFALIFALVLGLGLFNVALMFGLPHTVYHAALSVGVLMALWLFASVYIDFIPGGFSLAARLSTLMLTLFLAFLGAAGWFIAPPYIATFTPTLAQYLQDHETLRFTPHSASAYTVSQIPLRFETPLGERVAVITTSNAGRSHRVAFTFPYFGQTYREVYVTNAGAITLGEIFWYPDLQAATARVPTLFPLLVDLNPNPPGQDGGLFVRQEADRLIVTWYRLPAVYAPNTRYTFQAVLYADGAFDFTYNGLPPVIPFNPDETPAASPWLRGVVAGRGEPLHVWPLGNRPASVLTLARLGARPVLENYQLIFRRYLHTFMLPVAQIVISGSALLLALVPLLIRASIVRPLQALAAGVRRMEGGARLVNLPVQSADEIGFLTGAFNALSAALDDLVRTLEARVAARTAELRKLSVAVEQSPSSIIITNPHVEIEYVNAAFTASTGYTFEEVKGKNPRFLQSGLTPPETYRAMWEALKSGYTWRGELSNRRKNGDVYWEFTVIAPIFDEAGQIAHYVAVKEDVTARKMAEAELEMLTITDPLTGLLNRRGFFQKAEAVYARAGQHPADLGVLMLDIDYFKKVNDRYGHQIGDVVLQNVAACLQSHLRPTDLLARYGGEEFIALLPRTPRDTLLQIAQRLNAAVRAHTIEYQEIALTVTISIGAVMRTAETDSLETLIHQADLALYQAKQTGRDRTVLAGATPLH